MFDKSNKKILFFDMEMIPAEEEKRPMLEAWFHEKGKKDEDLNNAFELTSTDGAWGRILCVAYAWGDGPIETIYFEGPDEKRLLESTWDIIEKSDVVAGHKITDADIPFLWKRSIIHGVRPSRRFDLTPGQDDRLFDTAWYWSLGKDYASLEKVCLALDLSNPKEYMHGSQVPKFFREGRIEDILKYCQGDVEAVRNIYNKITPLI